MVRMNKEARDRFLAFAQSDDALWRANFRDLNAAIVRLATLAAGGRITTELVDEEIERLRNQWRGATAERAANSPLAAILTQLPQLST
jgi:transcriptional regulatory protein RtcR